MSELLSSAGGTVWEGLGGVALLKEVPMEEGLEVSKPHAIMPAELSAVPAATLFPSLCVTIATETYLIHIAFS